MSRTRPFLILWLVAVITCGCSTLHDFAIINSTTESLRVTIQYLNKQEVDFQTTTAELFQQSDKKWTALQASKVKVNQEQGSYTVDIAPGQALLVEETVNYLGHEDESFAISKLTLIQGEKTRTLEGKAAQTAFKKQDGLDYAFFFKGF